jgi:hypothetical protein
MSRLQQIMQLLSLTQALQEALDREDLESCLSLAADRGRLLKELDTTGVRQGDTLSAPERAALRRFCACDALLQDRAGKELQRLGRELARLRHTHRLPAQTSSCRVDRKV